MAFLKFFILIIAVNSFVIIDAQAATEDTVGTAGVAFAGIPSENPVQRTIRQVYSVLNGPCYDFADAERQIYTTLPGDIFEKRIDEQTRTPAFYSKDGVKPSAVIDRLIHPRADDRNVIECNIAASICQYAIFVEVLDGSEKFDKFSLKATSIRAALMPSQPRASICPKVLLGNRLNQAEHFAKDLLTTTLTSFDLSMLEPGAVVAIKNNSDYYNRHPQGRFGGENVVFYSWAGAPQKSEPLFFGFQGIFKDGRFHTLSEIQAAMLQDYLSEPTSGELVMTEEARRLVSARNTARIREFIDRIGLARAAEALCKPELIRRLDHDKIKLVRKKI